MVMLSARALLEASFCVC
ncbi:hypothetical protein Pint_04718 [Pistacia integerrima]|uniref:Uncharacterized protein n=1 Tax=Pistacia integerrima TaxID=434235 RepID=A0ACC0Z475_9ROSI|nr:hypothetical protein Pint_04718 [Pistacia integerrima]